MVGTDVIGLKLSLEFWWCTHNILVLKTIFEDSSVFDGSCLSSLNLFYWLTKVAEASFAMEGVMLS